MRVSREGFAIEAGQWLKAERVVAVLNRLVEQREAPRYLFADNGLEFAGHLVDLWARTADGSVRRSRMERRDEGYRCKVQMDFCGPAGRPTMPLSSVFNGSLRDECLNLHWFGIMAEAHSLAGSACSAR